MNKMSILADYGETKYTANLLEKFLSNMTTVVSSTPSAASPYASATMARKSNPSLCSHDGEIFPGSTKSLPLVYRSLVVPQDINDHRVAWQLRI